MVVGSCVVVDSGTALVVVVDASVVVVCELVDVSTVVDTGATDVDTSYRCPGRVAFGSPQQNPARKRYEPADTGNSMKDCNPNQSSLLASSTP